MSLVTSALAPSASGISETITSAKSTSAHVHWHPVPGALGQ